MSIIRKLNDDVLRGHDWGSCYPVTSELEVPAPLIYLQLCTFKILLEGLDSMPWYQLTNQEDLLTVSWDIAKLLWCRLGPGRGALHMNGRWQGSGSCSTIYLGWPLTVAFHISHFFIHLHSIKMLSIYFWRSHTSALAQHEQDRVVLVYLECTVWWVGTQSWICSRQMSNQ
jgi:hypothetical protein